QGFLFDQVNLQINRGEKIGLVGKNGAGKSTLLKIIAQQIKPSGGSIHLPKETKVGYLTQDIILNTELTLFSYLDTSNAQLNLIKSRLEDINTQLVTRTDYESSDYLSLLDEMSDLNFQFQIIDGFTWEERISETLKGLGFKENEFDNSLNTFSGGWKMRAELAKILINSPDLILLDEPTNHLDIISISWLEAYLQKFDGAVIIISHDRLFLDNVTKRTLEINNAKIFDFPFPFSIYKLRRQEEQERMNVEKKQQDREIKQTEELINKFRAKSSKAAFAQSLIKKLEKTERIEIDNDQTSKIKITFPLSVQPGKWVLSLEKVGKSYGNNILFSNLTITVGRGEKIALLGPNGVGKSTLLKTITKKIDFDGAVNYGHNVNVTYFAQDQAEQLDVEKSVFETVDDIARGEIRKDLRSILGTFLFSGEDIEKKVSVLSGGERTRLALCQLLLSPSNFLILDEPTNHLDIQSKQVLKNALQNYQGTFIIVSHDREFVDGLTNRIWDIEDQSLKIHHFTLNEYLTYKIKIHSSVTPILKTGEVLEQKKLKHYTRAIVSKKKIKNKTRSFIGLREK
ncbi:MAG: ABC-F family ATP-binding cassette domain-containing protein, partial [Bacteroidetes bacterium]|nr:ABC-F family ATP-binding cassette domain-containing protein [Bacteroidota bacterium]